MVKVRAAGIDTWSPCWYVDEGSASEHAMDALATQRTRRGMLVPDEISGHRIGWHPTQRLIYAEGHPDADRLGRPAELPMKLNALVRYMADVGIPLPKGNHSASEWPGCAPRAGFAGVRRLDSTVDLDAETPAVGLALMAAMAAIAPMRGLEGIVRFAGEGRYPRPVQSIAWEGRRGRVARVYDKGIESNLAPRGMMPRLESQQRWPNGHRRDPAELSSEYVRGLFVKRFAPLWQASKGIKVVSPLALVDEINDRIDRGELTPAQGEQLLGAHLLRGYNSRTRQRRRALVRHTGLVVNGGALEEVEVNVADVLEQVLDTDAWDRQG